MSRAMKKYNKLFSASEIAGKVTNFYEFAAMHGFGWKDELSKYADIGTMVHEMIEKDLCHNHLSQPKKAVEHSKKINDFSEDDIVAINNSFDAYKEFMHDHEVVVLSTEEKLAADDDATFRGSLLSVGCTIDMVAVVNGERVIVDWKTSSKLSDSGMVQIAANEIIRRTLGLDNIDTGMLIRLDKKGKGYEVKRFEIEKYFDLFISLYSVELEKKILGI